MFKNSSKDYKLPLWPLAPCEDVNSLLSLEADGDLCWHHRQSRHLVYKQRGHNQVLHTRFQYFEDFWATKLFPWIQQKRYKTSQRQNNLIGHAFSHMLMRLREYLGNQCFHKQVSLSSSPNTFILFYFLRQGLMYHRLALNSLCIQGWP